VKTLVIGSSGQLGHDLMKSFGEKTVGLTHTDIDVTDGVGVSRIVREQEPDWVINTAAFHRVDDCELNPALAFAVNAVGAANVARAAAEIGAGVVFFSTDYVFDGEARARHDPHLESSKPEPRNVYAVSKLAGEHLVMNANPRHLVIRSAGLYGTATSRKGWTFPELMVSKGRSDGWVKVVTDQALSPTYTRDLAETTRALMEREARGLFHLTNEGECSWYEFAQATFDIAGIAVTMEPTTTVTDERRAKRPSYSALASERLADVGVPPLRPWRAALEHYLKAKGLVTTTSEDA
jgi:dTDP-4-dehydrorhamnose reductase